MVSRVVCMAAMLIAGLTVGATGVEARQAAPPVTDARRIESIRDALLRLPYYGVFDFLTFTYERGTVVLDGYAYRGTLPADAERAVKRVPGVDVVTVRIKPLPVSMFDDDIRWRVFYAVYTNAFLERYNPGGGFDWGHLHRLRRSSFGVIPEFPGMQPVGSYPIHIVVEGGRVRLLGIVDNDADRTAAMLAARGVSGTFGVENELVVDRR